MDTSESYIKMCDCEEIQGKWKGNWNYIQNADVFYEGRLRGGWCLPLQTVKKPMHTAYEWHGVRNGCDLGVHLWEDIIWLPRQDQLQEMYCEGRGGRLHPLVRLLDAFTHWMVGTDLGQSVLDSRHSKFSSMEQLWLAFVMHECHGKSWNGERWIGDNRQHKVARQFR